MNAIPNVDSISDLRVKAGNNPLYAQLAITASRHLGGSGSTFDQALQHLSIIADETGDESTVVDEINFCINLLR